MARKMGYRPPNRTTHTVGLVVRGDMIGAELLGAFLREAEMALQARGFRLAVSAVWGDQVELLREVLTAKTVDGLIITESFGGRVSDLDLAGLPHVLAYDENNMDASSDVVTVDTIGTLERVTRHLLEQGHERICLVSVPGVMHSDLYRHMEQGVRRALARAGTPQENLRVLELSYDVRGNVAPDVYAAELVEGVTRRPACTAVMAADLSHALPGIQVLSQAGLRIPQDVSFISVVDSYYFPAMAPPVTATTFYDAAVARRAVERLLEKIEDPESPPRHERIAGEIIERGSVGPPGA